MAQRILVTPRSLTAERHPAVEGLRDLGYDVVYSKAGVVPDEAQLLSLVPGCVGWLAGVEPVTERVVEAARDLRVISRNGIGVDNLPIEVLNRRGIKIEVARGANSLGVAELTIGLMFAAMRSIPFSDIGIKNGAWPRRRGFEIHGRTVGVLGCGGIGREVARMAIGLGASVLAYDPVLPNVDLPSASFRQVSLDEVLAGSDVVSLHCPAASDGKPLIDARALASMRSDAVLVNTARASLVDEAALIQALDGGRLFAYATDVFAEEPPRERALAGHARVIATSHIGAFTNESVDRATAIAAANLVNQLRALEADRGHVDGTPG